MICIHYTRKNQKLQEAHLEKTEAYRYTIWEKGGDIMEILYSDRDLAVCVKPVGASSEDGPGSVPQLLRQSLGGQFYPVHRLDLNVGGVMVYARTRSAAAFLSRAVAEGLLKKEYRAIVHGTPPSQGSFQDLLWKDNTKNKVFVVKRRRKGVKEARLSYQVLQQLPDRALVAVSLETGRSHQIRVQFASRGYPLFGDGKYGAKDHCPAPALWSWRLTFPHPSGDTMTFSAMPSGSIWNI